MREVRSAAVLGLGLIGGSVARDLHASGVSVRGWDADRATVDEAVRQGIVRPIGPELRELADVDLLIIAVPVSAARELLPVVAARSGTAIVTDVGSTKRSMHAAAAAAGLGTRFVGSHPLAGAERSGWSASRSGMFEGARVFITPVAPAEDPAVQRVMGLWRSMGARPELTSPAEHDRLMAWASHAPQAISTTLALALADAGVSRAELGPGGLGATRLAASSPEVWADILADNSDEVTRALRSLASQLDGLASAVERADVAELRQVLGKARSWATEG